MSRHFSLYGFDFFFSEFRSLGLKYERSGTENIIMSKSVCFKIKLLKNVKKLEGSENRTFCSVLTLSSLIQILVCQRDKKIATSTWRFLLALGAECTCQKQLKRKVYEMWLNVWRFKGYEPKLTKKHYSSFFLHVFCLVVQTGNLPNGTYQSRLIVL